MAQYQLMQDPPQPSLSIHFYLHTPVSPASIPNTSWQGTILFCLIYLQYKQM